MPSFLSLSPKWQLHCPFSYIVLQIKIHLLQIHLRATQNLQKPSVKMLSFTARRAFATRSFATSARFQKSVVDSVKDAAKAVDDTVSKAAVSGIEKGGMYLLPSPLLLLALFISSSFVTSIGCRLAQARNHPFSIHSEKVQTRNKNPTWTNKIIHRTTRRPSQESSKRILWRSTGQSP